MGFFDSLGAEKYDRTYEDRDLARRIVGYFKPQKKRLVLISLLTLLVAGAGALLPVIVSRGIDLLGGLPKVLSLVLVAGAVLLVGVGIWLFNFGLRRLTSTAIAEVVAQLSSDAYKASVEHDLSFYDEFSSGKIVSRITSDTRDFGELVTLTTDVASLFLESLIPAAVLLKQAAQIAKGAANPKADKVGKVTKAQVLEIAKTKFADMNSSSLDMASRVIAGTARSMGIEVVD